MRRPFVRCAEIHPVSGRKLRLQEEPSAEGFLGGEVFPESLGRGYGLLGGACGARDPAPSHVNPVAIRGWQGGSLGRGWRWGVGLGEREERCRPENLLLYVALPSFGLRLQTGGPRPSVAHRYVLIGLCCA